MAVYLALGSNLGNREANLGLALHMLAPLVRVEAVSPLYESEPQLLPSEGSHAPQAHPERVQTMVSPAYLNAACRVVTGLGAPLLLRHVQSIEQLIGRRAAERWAPRPIDIDIVLYDDLSVAEAELVLPHPRLEERAFVLRPLLDLDRDLVQPRTGERLAVCLDRVGEAGLKRVRDAGWPRMVEGG